MDEFRTIAKIWPSGAELDLGTDSNLVSIPSSFNRHAANFVSSPDGTQDYQFLFWNTGRHLTNKRHVRWNFSVGGWGVWTATKWYGTPPKPGDGGPARVRADAFTIGGNAPLSSDTPIDGTASTYASGAWPSGGDDHVISTVNGAATVVAKDPFHSYLFAGWLKLVFGGDDSGEFVETDTGASPGTPGFYEHVSGPFLVPKGTSADLLATYGTHNDGGGIFQLPDWIWKVFGERGPIKIPDRGDPSPIDLIRLRLLEDLLRQTKPVGQAESADFQRLIETAPQMSPEELKRAVQSVKTTLNLGKTALTAIESHMKKK